MSVPRVDKFPILPSEIDDAFRRKMQEILREHALVIDDAQQGLKWDDLRFPSQGIDPIGLASPPGRNATDGLLDFDAAGIEVIAGVAQMPHAWRGGSAIRPHIHLLYRNAAAGNSRWKFEYKIANVNDDFPVSYTEDALTHTGPASAVKHCIFPFTEIDMSGYRDSCCILWKISRIGNDATNDTFAYDVALIEFDIHYQSDSRGSEQEYPV